MMNIEIIFLGTNGWSDTPIGSTLSVLVRAGSEIFILDAGMGLHRVDRFISPKSEAKLLLSHFHLDHVAGLHTLAKAPFAALDIFGPCGARAALATLVSDPYTCSLEKLGYPVRVHEVPNDPLPAGVSCALLHHNVCCLGYRLELNGRIIAFCTDTGPCNSAVQLAQRADLLVAECSLPPGATRTSGDTHLSPEMAANIAREAGVRQLMLVHFDPTNYPTARERNSAAKAAQQLFPRTEAAQDEQILRL